MIIKFERHTDQPDAAGHCKVYLVATFDGQRLRLSTGERCAAAEWLAEKSRFRKSLNGYQEANEGLDALGERVAKAYRELRSENGAVTAAQLKETLAPKVAAADLPPAPLLTNLFGTYIEVLRARGFGFTR